MASGEGVIVVRISWVRSVMGTSESISCPTTPMLGKVERGGLEVGYVDVI